MKVHLGTLAANAQSVITDAASLLKPYKDFVLEFQALTPNAPGDKCQIEFAGAFPNLGGPPYAFGDNGGTGHGYGMFQDKGTCGSGIVNGELSIYDPAEPNTPGVVSKGSITCDGVPHRIVNLWLVGFPATSFTISYPGGIKSGSVAVYGVA